MWRTLFNGWDFNDISIGEIALFCNKKVQSKFREFFHVFCITQSFDQYYLKVKGFIQAKANENSNNEVSNEVTNNDSSNSKSGEFSTSHFSSMPAWKTISTPVFNQIRPDHKPFSSSSPQNNIHLSTPVPNSSHIRTHNIRQIAMMGKDKLKLKDNKEEVSNKNNEKPQFIEYKNEIHSYEWIHSLLTEGMLVEV
jgi:hypothetical protein